MIKRRRLSGSGALVQKGVEGGQQVDAITAGTGSTQVGEGLPQQVIEGQARIREIGRVHLRIELVQHRVEQRRFSHADFGDHEHEPATALEADLQAGEGLRMIGAQVEERGIGRQGERLGA